MFKNRRKKRCRKAPDEVKLFKLFTRVQKKKFTKCRLKVKSKLKIIKRLKPKPCFLSTPTVEKNCRVRAGGGLFNIKPAPKDKILLKSFLRWKKLMNMK